MDEAVLRNHLEYITLRKKLPYGLSLSEVLSKLDAICKDEDLPDRLAHYLTKRSYVKALDWLDNPDLPHEV